MQITFQSLIDAWNYFFFAPELTATIAIFRIIWGTILLINGMLIVYDASFSIAPDGVYSFDYYERHDRKKRFSLLAYLPPTIESIWLLVAINIAASICIILGFLTPFSAAVTWLTLISLQMRNPYVCHGGDQVLRLMTFLLIFSPAGNMLSIDQLLSGSGIQSTQASPWAVRLMQLQISILYWRAVEAKVKGITWWNGTAAHYAIQNTEYQRLKPPQFTRRMWFIRSATYTTLAVEAGLASIVWIDMFRYPLIILGLLMHIGFDCFLNIQLFGPTMLAVLLLFIPAGDMEALLKLLNVIP